MTMDIDKLEAGPELDALVAEKVMNWDHRHDIVEIEGDCWYDHCRNCGLDMHCGERNDQPCEWPPSYSTDIAAAWQVVEKLAYNWTLSRDVGQCGSEYETAGDMLYHFILAAPGMPMQGVVAPTAPHAICLAALKAVTETELAD